MVQVATVKAETPIVHPVIRDGKWRTSDDAILARLSLYVALTLWNNPENRREAFNGVEPSWPAVIHYDPDTDLPYWIECKSRIHARDYKCGCWRTDQMNCTATLLAE